jgi:hypothetical protein
VKDDERLRDYIRARAEVSVPDDLRWPTTASRAPRRWAIGSSGSWGRLVAAVVVMAVVVIGVSLRQETPTGRTSASAVAPSGSPGSTGDASGGAFPSEALGLEVINVATADELLRSGKLDGHAVAVGGYFDQFTPPCPYPGRYIGPLEAWCQVVAFTDTRASAQLCRPAASNGITCSGPSGTNVAPFFMEETSGSAIWPPGGPTAEPSALVLIGHAGDARQWQCTAATRAQCAEAFVVDRIAWAEGHNLPATAPQTGDSRTGTPITPRMTLAQVATAIGLGDDLLTGAAFASRDIASVDPRWNLAGDNLVWLVRSIAPGTSGPEETRAETVWLVDDATGHVMDSHPLQLDSGYQPARLWEIATVHGVECCAGNVLPFFRVVSADGTVVSAGLVSGGSSGGPQGTTYGGGYRAWPLVLPAGDYSITSWLATYDHDVIGAPRDACSTNVTLRSLESTAINADYPQGHACRLLPATAPSPKP